MIAIYSYEQSLHCRVQLPLVVFVKPDGEWSIFLSSQQLRWLYLSAEIFGLKNHEWHLVPWSISACEGLHNWSYCLRCYLCVCKLCFPTASFVSYTLIADLAQVVRYLILTKWSYSFMPKSKSVGGNRDGRRFVGFYHWINFNSDYIRFEDRVWKRSQSINFSSGSEIHLRVW
jgi:hypothetical protein